MSLPAGGVLLVRGFVLEGAELIPERDLRRVLTPYEGQFLSMAQIEEAAGKVTALFRERGYLVARAYVPRQDASAGQLRLRVLVGAYGRFTLNNHSSVNDALIAQAFESIADSRAPVTLAGIERSMLLVSDMPGAELPSLTLSAGELQGTSDFRIDVPPGPAATAQLVGDNHGSPYTGQLRLNGGVVMNSPLGIADQLGVSVLGSEGGRLLAARVAYRFPLGIRGLRAELGAARTTYELGGAYRDLRASGAGSSFEGNLGFPLLRSRKRSIYSSFAFAHRRLNDTIGAVASSTARTISVGSLLSRYEEWSSLLGLDLYVNLTASLTEGHLAFADAEQEAFNRAGANTAGNYVHVKLDAFCQLELSSWLALSVTATTQKALNQNLDASEQLMITGSNGVRAYRTVISGDNGYLASAELRHRLGAASSDAGELAHSLSVFGDVGGVRLQRAGYSDFEGAMLGDTGAAYRVQRGVFFGNVQLARSLGSRPVSTRAESRNRVLLQLGMSL